MLKALSYSVFSALVSILLFVFVCLPFVRYHASYGANENIEASMRHILLESGTSRNFILTNEGVNTLYFQGTRQDLGAIVEYKDGSKGWRNIHNASTFCGVGQRSYGFSQYSEIHPGESLTINVLVKHDPVRISVRLRTRPRGAYHEKTISASSIVTQDSKRK